MAMSERKRIVIESPLSGDFLRNLRFALWCCRATYLAGYAPAASHLLCPWFMDDRSPEERADGIDWPWFWQPDIPHWFCTDLGISDGMYRAAERCGLSVSQIRSIELSVYAPSAWAAFERGEWPPHTPGFEVHSGE